MLTNDIMVDFPDADESGDDDEEALFRIVRGSVVRESDSRASFGFTEPEADWCMLAAMPRRGPDPWRGQDAVTTASPMRRWRLPFPPIYRTDGASIYLREWPRPPVPSTEAANDFASEVVADAFLALRWRHYLLWRVDRSRRRRPRANGAGHGS